MDVYKNFFVIIDEIDFEGQDQNMTDLYDFYLLFQCFLIRN